MPLCDAYIPNGALEPAAERDFIKRVSDILVSHEARRIIDLMDDPKEVESVHRRAGLISWLFVHRTEAYVDGRPVPAPLYRFLVSIPEGQIDEAFVPAINRDIFQALKDAEPEGREHLERRLWITVQEIVDGMWGSAGRQLRLKEIVDVVAPGWGEHASTRFAEKTRTDAQALVKLAQDRGVAA